MTEIKVKNFQSISSAELNIDGFTVIVGKNNIGKSAIIRSINAALTNQSGDDFIRDGEKSTEVYIKRDGLDLFWKKGDSSTYKINNTTYTKLNRAVPQPILDHGFRSLEIGNDSDLNPLYASQFEPVFLLNRSGPQVTEALSKIYDLDTISKADDLCQKETRSVKSLIKTRTEDLSNLNTDLEVFRDFDSFKKCMEDIQNLENTRLNLLTEISLISQLFEDYKKLDTTVNILKGILLIEIPDSAITKDLLENVKWLSDKEKDFSNLSKIVSILSKLDTIEIPLIDQIPDNIENYNWLLEKVSELKNIKTNLISMKPLSDMNIPDISALSSGIDDYKNINNLNSSLKELVLSLKSIKNQIKIFDIDSIKSSSELSQSLINDVIWIVDTYTDCSSTRNTINNLEDSLKETSSKLDEAIKEKSAFNNCPACGSSL